MKQLFFCLLALVFVSSCTIEKRHYLHGFYVDRHQAIVSTAPSPEEKSPQAVLAVKQASSGKTEYALPAKDTMAVATAAATPPPSFKRKVQQILQQQEAQNSPSTKPSTTAAADGPVTNRLSTLAFGCAILAVAAALTLIFGWGFAFFALIFAPMALIFGLIARNQIRREPEKYKNKYYATIGIIVGAATFLVAIVFVAAVFIALANFQ